MQGKATILIVLLLALTFIATQSYYIVDEREQAIKLFLGAPDGDPNEPSSFIKGPGLHFKIPLVHQIRYFDRRILSIDPPPEQVVISSGRIGARNFAVPAIVVEESENDVEVVPETTIENVSGEPIIVDTFARYKITDPLQFFRTLQTKEQANNRLQNILNDATRAVLGQATLRDLLSDERAAVMRDILERVNRKTADDELGIEIVDVRIVRADLTPDLRASTVRRMISELRERATETRAGGEERALEIRSTAEKERDVIIAEARRDSEIIRGDGDRDAIKIYADAFNQDQDFYAFYRSLEAYRNALANPETTLVITPDSKFFEFFESID